MAALSWVPTLVLAVGAKAATDAVRVAARASFIVIIDLNVYIENVSTKDNSLR